MNRIVLGAVFVSSLVFAVRTVRSADASAPDPTSVARSFLPPNCQLASLYTFDYAIGREKSRWPAVLTGHILSTDSPDIVFAYYCPQIHVFEKTLFLDVLHEVSGNYEKVYEITYRARVLFVPRAIRLIRLQGIDTDAVTVVTAMGAALGGQLEIFVWRDPWGWQNIFPANGSVHYFYFFDGVDGFRVALSFSHQRGLNVSPPPKWYRWDGKRFVETPTPKGSPGSPLPD